VTEILGGFISQDLRLDQNVNSLVLFCFYQVRNIAKIMPIVSLMELAMIANAFVSSHLPE